MIYFEMSDEAVERGVWPKYMMSLTQFDNVSRKFSHSLLLSSDFIFEVKNGVTRYYKDRGGTGHQYTPEDEVVLRLKSVLL